MNNIKIGQTYIMKVKKDIELYWGDYFVKKFIVTNVTEKFVFLAYRYWKDGILIKSRLVDMRKADLFDFFSLVENEQLEFDFEA